MASDDFLPHFIANEDNKCKLCTESGSPSDSPSRLSGGTQSNSNNKVNNSKPSSQCGHFQLDYSNDFHANISRRAGSSSSCSEQISCGSSQNYYDDDFQTYSSETSRRSSSSSSCSSTLEQPDTKKEELPKKKSGKDHPAKGGKTLPKRKKQQKINCDTSNVINSQKNNVARRLLSASLHNIKELKNEVSVLNNKLEAANMENQILKKLQLRHLKAISKYENAEINLPDLIAKHCGEVETLRALLRKSQEQEWNASRKLREVEAQLLKTKDTLQALQKLSEDKHLTEREELKHKVTALSERMVANDKKIQDLEKQLALNNTSFIHQLAVEKKKTLDAQAVTTNLKMEIKLLNQKIKEKEREIAIRNIYANRMLKDQQKKGDSESVPEEVNVSISVQVDMNLESLPFQKHERKQSAVLSKEAPPTKDVCAKDKMNDVNKEMEPKPEAHQTEKLPVQEVSDRTCSELLEDISLSNEKYFKCENIERQKNRRDRQGLDLLKEEFEKLCTEESLQSTHDSEQKENNLGEAVTENQENENKRDEPEVVVSDKLATVIQRHKTPSKLKKQYKFTEAVENLHQGFPSTRRLSNTSTTGNSRQVNTHPSDIAEFKGNGSTSAYEPSFGNTTNTKQGISVHSEDRIPTVSAEKKNTLMQELFGTSSILQDNNLKPNFEDVGKEKKSLQNEKFDEDISYMHDSFQCGDSKQTPIKGFDTVSFLENLK